MCGARVEGRGKKGGPSRRNGSDADAGDQGGRKQEGSALDCGGRGRGRRVEVKVEVELEVEVEVEVEARKRAHQEAIKVTHMLEIKVDVSMKGRR